jgi:hypothetical protein
VSNHARKYLDIAPASERKSPLEVFDEAVRAAYDTFIVRFHNLGPIGPAYEYRKEMQAARNAFYGGARLDIEPAPKVRGLTQAQVLRFYGIAA